MNAQQLHIDLPIESALAKRFRQWIHTAHGREVEELAIMHARAMQQRGKDRYGMRAIFEVIRFHKILQSGTDADDWKVNNSYVPYLARKIMRENKDLEGFFETRKMKYEDE